MCDRKVWLHLLKQTAHFSKQKLEELVDFAGGEDRSPELMRELLRVAASRWKFSPEPRQKNLLKITWTVPGWGAPDTLLTRGIVCNVKELTNVARTVGVKFTILEVQCSGCFFELAMYGQTKTDLHLIASHVEQQGEKLSNLELPVIMSGECDAKEIFLSLQRRSLKWSVGVFHVTLEPQGHEIQLGDLAGIPLETGHIGTLVVHKRQEQVSLDALNRVWKIADEMSILMRVDLLNPIRFQLRGGRGEDQEKAWQHVVNFFHNIDAN